MVNNTVYQFVGSKPGGWDIFEKEGTSEKRCVEIEHWGFSLHFALGFQENFIYPYVLSEDIIYKIVQSFHKNWLLVSKIKNLMGYKYKKYIASARALLT